MAASTAAASRISPARTRCRARPRAGGAASRANYRRRRARLRRAQQRLHQRGADEAAAAGDQNARTRSIASSSTAGHIDPAAACVGALCGIDQILDAITFGKARRGRDRRFASVEKAPHQPRHRCDARIGGRVIGVSSATDDGLQATPRREALHERKAAEIIAGGIARTRVPSSP